MNASSADELLPQLHELLDAQRRLNLSLPSWCTDGVLELLGELTQLRHIIESRTAKLRRLNGGPLLRRFLEPLLHEPRVRVRLHSAEARDLAGLIRACGLRFPRRSGPGPGSAVVLERHRDPDGGLLARVALWTGTTRAPFPVRLRGCQEMCPVQQLAGVLAENLPSDEEICGCTHLRSWCRSTWQ